MLTAFSVCAGLLLDCGVSLERGTVFYTPTQQLPEYTICSASTFCQRHLVLLSPPSPLLCHEQVRQLGCGVSTGWGSVFKPPYNNLDLGVWTKPFLH
jgi:Zn-dependent alcohol dehydrogenase